MTRTLSALLMSTALAVAACSDDRSRAQNAPESVVTDIAEANKASVDIPHAQLPQGIAPTAYAIDMRIDPDADTMSGRVAMDVEIDAPVERIWLHAKAMTVSKATLDRPDGTSRPLTFNAVPLEEAPSGVAWLSAEDGGEIAAGTMTITLDYETPYNLALNSAYKVSRGADENYIVTQFEPLGAREAFPSFDEPRFKVPFDVSITAPDDMVVFANTPKTQTTSAGGGYTRHDFARTRPLPTYLIAFGVGPYDVVDGEDIAPNDIRERGVELRGFTARGSGPEIEYGLAGTEPILAALEEYFGTEYPYEKLDLIAAPDYAFGAMENPGAIVYREYLMLLDEDSPLNQKRAYNRVHSHELAHQWFGNLVTPVWWEDIWLNEAFATWMGNKGTDLAYPDGNYDRLTLNAALGAMNIDSLSTTRRVREPLARSENVMDQFDGITYRKGGGVLSMFESFVGEAAFRDGVRLHMERYADGVATADDFFQSIADGSGNPDVVEAMKSFVDQKGVPLISAKVEALQGADTVLTISQSRYAPLGSSIAQGAVWQIPVCAKFGFGDDPVKQCTLLTETVDRISAKAEDGEPADWVMPNADGAGYYRFTLGTAGWTALLDNLGRLNTKEVLATQDSLTAAFRAGEVEPSVYLSGMEAFAAHPEFDVASTSGQMLGFMYDELPEARDDLAGLIADIYADRYARLAGQTSTEAELLNPTLASNLVYRAGDAELTARLAEAGADYLGLGRDADKSGIRSNLLDLALTSALRADPEALEPLLDMVESGSAFEKGAAVVALGRVRDAELGARVREETIAQDSPFTGRQATSVLSVMMGNAAQEDATWDWVRENFDALVARVPDVRKPGLPNLAGVFCSAEEKAEMEDFFRSKAALIPGYERSLAQVGESIDLCAALKAERGDAIVTALAERN